MDRNELNSAEFCFICNEYMSSCRNDLSVVTGYSEQSIFSIIESLIERSIADEAVSKGAALCQSCMMKFNEYDFYLTKATQLKNELISTFTSRTDVFHPNLLFDDFPEFDFDLNDLKVIDESTISTSTSPHRSDEVSENFQKILDKEGIKYDIEVFQRAFGDETSSKTEKKLQSIKRNYSRSKKFTKFLTCDFCAMNGFTNRRDFIAHLKSHQKTPYYCSHCKTSFKAANSLKIHFLSDHGNITKNIPCSYTNCNKNFATPTALRAHFICHSKTDKIPSFVCDTCGKGFHYKLSFTQHLKIHTGIRDKQCERCGFRATSSTHLQRHIRARHTKEKNHICSFCQRAFSERYNMMSHLRKQHLEKKAVKKSLPTFFKCIVCFMEYSDKFRLQQHMELSHDIVQVEHEDACIV